jgi:hypothetical protein
MTSILLKSFIGNVVIGVCFDLGVGIESFLVPRVEYRINSTFE